MKINSNKIFVSFNPSMQGELKAGFVDYIKRTMQATDYAVVELEYLLACGDISDIPFSNTKLYTDLLFEEIESVIKKTQASLKRLHKYNSNGGIEIFVDKCRANDICNLYYFAKEFKSFSNARLNYCHTELITDKGATFEIAVVDESIPLTEDLLDQFSKKWDELVSNNNAIRVTKNGELVEYSIEQAKEKILNVFTHEFVKFPVLLSNFYKTCEDEEMWEYASFEYVTYILINEGTVERTKDKNTNSGCSDIYFEQKFRIRN